MRVTDLGRRILGALQFDAPISSSELVFFVKDTTHAVLLELGALVSGGAVKRHHFPDGTLRYTKVPPKMVPRRERASIAPVIEPVSRRGKVHIDIHVDVALQELERIALFPNPDHRRKAFDEIGAALGRYLESSMPADVTHSTGGTP